MSSLTNLPKIILCLLPGISLEVSRARADCGAESATTWSAGRLKGGGGGMSSSSISISTWSLILSKFHILPWWATVVIHRMDLIASVANSIRIVLHTHEVIWIVSDHVSCLRRLHLFLILENNTFIFRRSLLSCLIGGLKHPVSCLPLLVKQNRVVGRPEAHPLAAEIVAVMPAICLSPCPGQWPLQGWRPW